MNSDQKIECDRLNDEIWAALEKIDELEIRKTTLENNLSLGRGKLSRLNDELRVKKGALFTAKVGSLIPGPAGKAGGLSIPVLEAEIRQIEQKIASVEADMSQAKQDIFDADFKISNYKNGIAQDRAKVRQLGCWGFFVW